MPLQKRKTGQGKESIVEEGAFSKMSKPNQESTSKDQNEKDDSKSTSIKQFPDDVLTKIVESIPIFQWPSLESVDRKFRKAVHESWLSVTKINLDEDLIVDSSKIELNGGQRALNSILKKLTLRAPNLTTIGGFRSFGTDSFDDTSVELLANFNFLECIDLKGCESPEFGKLAQYLEKNRCRLKELNADSCFFESIRDQEIQETGEEDLCSSPVPNDEAFLQYLNVVDSSSLKTLDDAWVHTMHLAPVIDRCDNLERLSFGISCDHSIDECDYLEYNQALLQSIGNLQNLKSLKITGNLSDDDECAAIHDDFLDLIVTLGQRPSFTEISLLDWVCCTNEILKAIADNLPNLTSLEFCTDKCGSDYLAYALQRLTKLERLQLRIAAIPISKSTDRVVSAIAANLPDLKHLYLDAPDGCGPQSLNKLSLMENLEELCIDHGDLRVETLVSWSEGFPSLESLRLPVCQKIFDNGFVALIKKLNNLRRLDLDEALISDRSLEAIADSCPNLRWLNLSRCKKITLSGVQKVVDKCSKLKYLKLEESGSEGWNRWARELKVAKYRKIIT